MPCHTIRETKIDLEAADASVLIRGLEAAGLLRGRSAAGVEVETADGRRATIAGGKVSVFGGDLEIVDEIKRAYSAEAVKTAAKRFGYTLTTDSRTGQITAGRRF